MRFRRADHIGMPLLQVCTWPRGLPTRTAVPRFVVLVNAKRHQCRSILPVVHSAINLALPHGPFDNSAVTYRASCNAGTIPPEEEERLLPIFMHSELTPLSSPIGFLRPTVVDQILKDHAESGNESIWDVLRRPDDYHSPWAICFADRVADFETRTDAVRMLLEKWRTKNLFLDILKCWSNETCPVYMPLQERHPGLTSSSLAFGVERASLPLFGFVNFGCLLTAFYDCPVTSRTMVWIARRSLSKSTWPGWYDCTAGGGIGLEERPNETIVRECAEEACLAPDFVRKHIRSTGMLNYANRSPSGWLLPGIYYLYELRLPHDGTIAPHTNTRVLNEEVDAFQLMDVEEVLQRVRQEQFKPSSAMALVDFCIRRGILTPESDPGYLDICMALRKPVVLPLP